MADRTLELGQYFVDGDVYQICADIPAVRNFLVKEIQNGFIDPAEVTLYQRVAFPTDTLGHVCEELDEGFCFVVVEDGDGIEAPEYWISEALWGEKFQTLKQARQYHEKILNEDETDSTIICLKKIGFQIDVKIDET